MTTRIYGFHGNYRLVDSLTKYLFGEIDAVRVHDMANYQYGITDRIR